MLEKISNMIPHLVDSLIKYNDCAIKETHKKMFPITESLIPVRKSVCLCDISCSTTAGASGSKSVIFHAREWGEPLRWHKLFGHSVPIVLKPQREATAIRFRYSTSCRFKAMRTPLTRMML
jgi:hypothetical protein